MVENGLKQDISASLNQPSEVRLNDGPLNIVSLIELVLGQRLTPPQADLLNTMYVRAVSMNLLQSSCKLTIYNQSSLLRGLTPGTPQLGAYSVKKMG